MDIKTKKKEQLGMDPGTASSRLKKQVLFTLVIQSKLNVCFQCKEKINTPEELSIEHKVPWLDSDNPKELFFDLRNIVFSHIVCNIKARRITNKKFFTADAIRENNRNHTRKYDRREDSKEKRKIRRKKRFDLTGKW